MALSSIEQIGELADLRAIGVLLATRIEAAAGIQRAARVADTEREAAADTFRKSLSPRDGLQLVEATGTATTAAILAAALPEDFAEAFTTAAFDENPAAWRLLAAAAMKRAAIIDSAQVAARRAWATIVGDATAEGRAIDPAVNPDLYHAHRTAKTRVDQLADLAAQASQLAEACRQRAAWLEAGADTHRAPSGAERRFVQVLAIVEGELPVAEKPKA